MSETVGTYGNTITTGLTLTTDPTTITSSGTIGNTGYYGNGVTAALGTPWSLINFGTIIGGTEGDGVSLPSGILTNAGGGLIEGSIGVYLGTGTLTDAGTIVGRSGIAVSFGSGAADALTLDPGAMLSGAVAGFVAGDSIDLAGIAATAASFAAGTLTVFDQGVAVDRVALAGDFTSGEFGLYSDGQGGTNITLGAATLTGQYGVAITLTALDTTIASSAAVTVAGNGITAGSARDFTLTNQGGITNDGSVGNAVNLPDGVLTNAVTGVIGGLGGVDIVSGTLVNQGTIGNSASFDTSAYVGSGTIDNQASGVITGPIAAGIGHGAVVNFGIIAGGAGANDVGVAIALSGNVTNAAGGIIEGAVGVRLDAGTLINAGLIRSTAPSGIAVQFGALTDVLVVDPGSRLVGAVAGMIAGDTIDLAQTTITGESFANGVLTLSNGGGIVDTFSLTGAFDTGEFTLAPDGLGGTALTLGAATLSAAYGAGLSLTALDTTIAAAATIAASTGSGVYGSSPRFWTVVNDGAVNAAAGYGIDLVDRGGITNNGTVIGSIGVYLGTGSLLNAGDIVGTAGVGVYQGAGVLRNDGTITGISGAIETAGTIVNAGLMQGTGTAGFGARIDAGTLDNAAGGVLTGHDGAYLQSSTLINAGTIIGAAGIGVEIGSGVSSILIDPGSSIVGAIAGFGLGDVIDFVGVSLTAARFDSASGSLIVTGSGGATDRVGLAGDFIRNEFALTPDGNGGTDVAIGSASATGVYAGVTLTALYTSFAPSATVQSSSNVAAVFGAATQDWTVANSGTITDNQQGDGIDLTNSATLINRAGGVIAGGEAVYVSNGVIDNAGTLSGAFIGALAPFGIIDNAAGGTIAGQYGAYVAVGTIINAGTIESVRGNAGTAALIRASGTVVDDPGAVFIGSVIGPTGSTATSLLELAAGATEGTLAGFGTQFRNFGTLEVATGATWNIAGTTTITGTLINNGTIIETAADSLTIHGTIEGNGTIVNAPATGVVDDPVGPSQGGIAFDANCFAEGTAIATARGTIPVEHLQVGDLARLADGGVAPIVWLGRRTVQPPRHPQPANVNPILIEPGALADGLPCRALRLSPDHALLLDGHLIPAKSLLNGTTIRQIDMPEITYHHVELPTHGIILAESVAAESYLDTGNRDQFENGGTALRLHPDFAQTIRESTSCVPFADAGPVVEAVRARLLARAAIPTTEDAEIRIEPHEKGAMIRSRHFIPAELTADPRDARRLGIKIATIAIAGIAIPLDHPTLRHGWHDREEDGRWTDGAALVPAALMAGATAAAITITLASTARYRKAA